MIESLAEHGVAAMDLVPALMTTHTVANPEYDPAEAKRKDAEEALARQDSPIDESHDITALGPPEPPTKETHPATPKQNTKNIHLQTTANVMEPLTPTVTSMPGVSTSLSATDANVTLDIRWTVLCDLFLILIADSVYDARSRVLLEIVATKLGLGWIDVIKFEKRVTEALEIQEGVERLEQREVIDGRMKSAAKKRYMMMGLATLGVCSSRVFDCTTTPLIPYSILARQVAALLSVFLLACWHLSLALVSVLLSRLLGLLGPRGSLLALEALPLLLLAGS